MKSKKILLVEDDVNLGYVVQDNLTVQGFQVTLCDDGEKGWEAFKNEGFDVCILDVMLPKTDGFTLAEKIRNIDQMIPIIFLTAKSMKEDRIAGFRKGGDDYITKPFSIEELVLRIKVFLKRVSGTMVSPDQVVNTFSLGKYQFDHTNLALINGEESRTLTQKEAGILKLFCDHPGQVLKREHILKEIWGDDDYFLGRSLDVFISKLRKYLKGDVNIEIINHHGVGFKLQIGEEKSVE